LSLLFHPQVVSTVAECAESNHVFAGFQIVVRRDREDAIGNSLGDDVRQSLFTDSRFEREHVAAAGSL
jgi:hypothetical protein